MHTFKRQTLHSKQKKVNRKTTQATVRPTHDKTHQKTCIFNIQLHKYILKYNTTNVAYTSVFPIKNALYNYSLIAQSLRNLSGDKYQTLLFNFAQV